MPPMKSTGVLHQPSFEHESGIANTSIQTRRVESLANPRRRRKQHERLLLIAVLSDLPQHFVSGLLSHLTIQSDIHPIR